jgi:hypothetical protein
VSFTLTLFYDEHFYSPSCAEVAEKDCAEVAEKDLDLEYLCPLKSEQAEIGNGVPFILPD